MNQHTLHWDHSMSLNWVHSKKNHNYNTSSSSSTGINVNNMNLVKIIIIVHPDLLAN